MRTLLLLLAVLGAAFATTPAELIDNIVKNPGYFSQNCRGPAQFPADELPLFGYRRSWSDVKISPENFLKLRAQRRDVLREIAVQLDAMNVERSRSDFSRGEMLLMMIQDLNGVEALAALVRLEKAFDKVAWYRTGGPAPAGTRSAYPAHVQVLSTISAILKNENAAGGLGKVKARYDQSSRDQIVGLADKFLDGVDPSAWRRGAAMSEKPDYR